MAARINSKIRRQARRKYAARKRQVKQSKQGQQDLFPTTGKVCVSQAVGEAKLAEIMKNLNDR